MTLNKNTYVLEHDSARVITRRQWIGETAPLGPECIKDFNFLGALRGGHLDAAGEYWYSCCAPRNYWKVKVRSIPVFSKK